MQEPHRGPHLIAVFADLTERKLAEEKLLQLQLGLAMQVRERTREQSATVEQLHIAMAEVERNRARLRAITDGLPVTISMLARGALPVCQSGLLPLFRARSRTHAGYERAGSDR